MSARPDLEKGERIRLIAYGLWLARREANVSGDANLDYFNAERILESYRNLKLLLLGSFACSAVGFVLGRLTSEHYSNVMDAVFELGELGDKESFSPAVCEKLLQPDLLQLMAHGAPGFSPDSSGLTTDYTDSADWIKAP